jgi:mRNA-degrading endonuclease toxin of MazEF toxin-antitoxin module
MDVVIVSADPLNEALQKICMVVPLTSVIQKTGRQFRILIPESQKIPEPGTKGCPGDSLALTEQTRCISTERLLDMKRVGRIKTEAIAAVEAGIRFVLAIP